MRVSVQWVLKELGGCLNLLIFKKAFESSVTKGRSSARQESGGAPAVALARVVGGELGKWLLCTTAIALALSPRAAAGIITNGSFADVSPTVPANGICTTNPAVYPAVEPGAYPACIATGWTGNYQIASGRSIGAFGVSFGIPQPYPNGTTNALILQAELNLAPTATQSINIPATGFYTLTFYVANRSNVNNGPQTVSVLLDNALISGGTYSNLPAKWTLETLTFSVSAGIHSLTLEGLAETSGATSANVAAFVAEVSLVAASTAPPFGSFDTPANDSAVSGAVAVTGWALSAAGIASVDIWRAPNPGETPSSNGLVYVGAADLVAGARPDVEQLYPAYPGSNQAGWGLQLLTKELPSNTGTTTVGNGTYALHAIATGNDGQSTDLGTKTITVNNAGSVLPFGTIDTPTQGGTASGSAFVNFGWVLTPQPNIIPVNGSTIWVYIDNVPQGHPVYNNPRADIEALFPSYQNTDGAVGYFVIDTTKLANGVHTIFWTVEDSDGNAQGIGSRYFAVTN